jgi:hypothetical protein
MLGGEVEVNETFIGGKARNQHKRRRIEAQKEGRNTGDKAVVVGILERGSKSLRATVAPDRTEGVMQEAVRGNVEKGRRFIRTRRRVTGRWMTSTRIMWWITLSLRARQRHTNGFREFLEFAEAWAEWHLHQR